MNMNLLAVIQKIKQETGHDPGKKQLQKLVYLIQAKGIDLGYEYGIHFYGPYAEQLSQDLLSLCVNRFVDFRVEGQTHEIASLSEPVEMDVSPDDSRKIDSLIHRYRNNTPQNLELLTTVHFIAKHLGSSDDEIFAGMKRLKGDKFPRQEIESAIKHLRTGYAI